MVFPPLAGSLCLLLLSRDDDLLLVGAAGTLALHDARTGALLDVVRPPSTEILSIEYRGTCLALEHRDAATVFMDRRNGSTVSIDVQRRGRAMRWPFPVRVSADGRFRACPAPDEAYGVLDAQSDRLLWSIGWEGYGLELAFSPDSRLLAAGTSSVLRLHDAETGEVVGEWSKLRSPMRAITFSPDGSELACGCEDGSVVIFSVPAK